MLGLSDSSTDITPHFSRAFDQDLGNSFILSFFPRKSFLLAAVK